MKTVAVLAFGLFMACGGEGRVPTTERKAPTAEQLLKENRDALRLEERDIDRYVERNALQLTKTGTGLRYRIVRDASGAVARPDQWVKVNYRVQLLNGDTAYSTESGPESFMVEMDQVESGLHEGIQLMSPGDSAIIIIPSYRAHGLIGDQDKIPMRSTIVYHIGLISAKDRP